ncbi:baculoviral IAP repeat-containing protein 3-like [Littorina saxatilis]|uniref:baculoviral IAP repeat-containing protein 3-like n=1 Tax=Littorina saxatilis TaxID=31220 RepID=UPI0038B63815
MVIESLQRLSTFAKWPMPSDACSGITNFVSKAAAAHFERTAECVDDEVVCKSCGVSFKNWKNESPAAVHRTISPKCPAMNPSSSESQTGSESECSTSSMPTELSSLQQNPFLKFLPDRFQNHIACAALQTEDHRTPERASGTADDQELPADQTPEQPSHSRWHQGADGVRRVLFPDPDVDHTHGNRNQSAGNTASEAEGPHILESHSASSEGQPKPPSVLDQVPITHPFRTKSGGYDNLFASNRQKTFPGPTTSLKHQAWAEEGFIYREMEEDLLCVFCGTVMVVNGHRPKVAHAKACPSCPFVMGFDVGNILLQQEKEIRLKFFEQQAAKKQSVFDLCVKYPHYEQEEERKGSFENWPKVFQTLFPSSVMVSAGFYYSGYSDKVICYSCGLEAYNWTANADVLTTHAKVSPTCLHVISHKGQEFIAEAIRNDAEIQAEIRHHKDSSKGSVTGSYGVIGEEPGSCNLDMTAVKAALACRYPNKAILKASLKAADENHDTICKQQQAIHQVHSELERKEKDVQQSHTVIQHKDTEIQHKDTEIQHKDTVIQYKDTEIQHKDTVIQHKDTVIQEQGTQLQRVIQEKEQIAQIAQQTGAQLGEKDAQLGEKNAELVEKDEQLQLQDQQIRSLMQQVQQLRADDHNRAHPGPAGDAAGSNNHHHSLVCKICQSDKPRMIFLPCGHLFCCAECTPRLPDRRCPVCRRDISEVLPAFVA